MQDTNAHDVDASRKHADVRTNKNKSTLLGDTRSLAHAPFYHPPKGLQLVGPHGESRHKRDRLLSTGQLHDRPHIHLTGNQHLN